MHDFGVPGILRCIVIKFVWSGFKLSSAKAVQEVHRWRKVSHINVVALYEMFTTKLFGDNCKCSCFMVVICFIFGFKNQLLPDYNIICNRYFAKMLVHCSSFTLSEVKTCGAILSLLHTVFGVVFLLYEFHYTSC